MVIGRRRCFETNFWKKVRWKSLLGSSFRKIAASITRMSGEMVPFRKMSSDYFHCRPWMCVLLLWFFSHKNYFRFALWAVVAIRLAKNWFGMCKVEFSCVIGARKLLLCSDICSAYEIFRKKSLNELLIRVTWSSLDVAMWKFLLKNQLAIKLIALRSWKLDM